MPDTLETLFAQSDTPAPRGDLSERIMSAARDQALAQSPAQSPILAANDRAPWHNKRVLAGMTAIAATLVAGFFVMTGQPSEAELWASHADDSGFGELYDWVYADMSETQ